MNGIPAEILAKMRQSAWRMYDRDLAELTAAETYALVSVDEAEVILIEAFLEDTRRKAARYDAMVERALAEAETWANVGGDR